MWRFSDVSGTKSPSSGCDGTVSGSIKPPAHPEEGDRFSLRIVWKPSHLDVVVCPKKFHWLLSISSPFILIIVPFFCPFFSLALLFLHYHSSFFIFASLCFLSRIHSCILSCFSVFFCLILSVLTSFNSLSTVLSSFIPLLHAFHPSIKQNKKETYRTVSNSILCPVQRGKARLSELFSPLATTCLTHELRAILAPAGILG